jgi:hypothetical protein
MEPVADCRLQRGCSGKMMQNFTVRIGMNDFHHLGITTVKSKPHMGENLFVESTVGFQLSNITPSQCKLPLCTCSCPAPFSVHLILCRNSSHSIGRYFSVINSLQAGTDCRDCSRRRGQEAPHGPSSAFQEGICSQY